MYFMSSVYSHGKLTREGIVYPCRNTRIAQDGMGAKKLANETGMPYMEAKRIIDMYWKLFPKIKTFFDDFVKESMSKKCIVSPYDQRLRWLDGFDTDSGKDLSSIKNMSMNFPMQSGNASVIKKALATLRKRIIGKDIKILSTVHDEIVVLAHKDVAEEALQLTTSSMISEAEDYIKNVPVEVKGIIDVCWTK
jgi:DNA polymerase I-like protein with 3'-5' exonuclease and polymerase domains